MATTTPVFPLLSRTFKSQPHFPNNDNRKRKRTEESVSFEVRPSTNGVGMFATKNISCGDLIIDNEDPIVHCSSTNHPKPNVCNTCAAPIGSLRENHLMAPQDIILPYLDDDTQGLVFTTSHVTCQGCKEVAWCSDKCYQKGRLQHAILCGSSSLGAFYGTQENPIIFQLATQSVLLILSQLATLSKQERMPLQQFYWWKDYGSHPLWWEVGSSRDTKKDRAKEFCRVFQEALLESVRQKRIVLDETLILQICALENVGSILGMLQCNVMEYEYPSPTQQYMAHVEEILEQVVDEDNQGDIPETLDHAGEEGSHINAVKAGCHWLVKNVLNETIEPNATNEGSKRQSNSAGSGLYPLLTLANHDCNPNASIEFLQESNRGTMVATRDISAGEEICITYVPNGGVGSGDSGEYFSRFEPTRTWEWLNNLNDDESSTEQSLDNNDNIESLDDEDDNPPDDGCFEEGVDEQAEEEQLLEGSNQRERAKALLEYDFDCQCIRCLDEQRKDKN